MGQRGPTPSAWKPLMRLHQAGAEGRVGGGLPQWARWRSLPIPCKRPARAMGVPEAIVQHHGPPQGGLGGLRLLRAQVRGCLARDRPPWGRGAGLLWVPSRPGLSGGGGPLKPFFVVPFTHDPCSPLPQTRGGSVAPPQGPGGHRSPSLAGGISCAERKQGQGDCPDAPSQHPLGSPGVGPVPSGRPGGADG